MAIKPTLFSTPMVQAIKANRKKQTRRLIKFDSEIANPKKIGWSVLTPDDHYEVRSVDDSGEIRISFGKEPISLGDILWVRETWTDPTPDKSGWPILYKADFPMVYHGTEWDPNEVITLKAEDYKWKPSIFMPKEAARIFLKVTNVRAERLQDISEDDAIAEGILRHKKAYRGGTAYYDYSGKQTRISFNFDSPIESFKTLWQSINGRESWDANPWVWVYEFEQIEKPKDFGNE